MENKVTKYSNHGQCHNAEEISLACCENIYGCLNILGYSQEMIKYRQVMNRRMDEIFNKKRFAVNTITSGGKAEGTALYYESDIDRLYEVKDVACVEPGVLCSTGTVFHLDRTSCSPGYTRLKLASTSEDHYRLIEKYLVMETDDTKTYISNSVSPLLWDLRYIDINGDRLHSRDRKGPALRFQNNSIKYDFVVGFKCQCSDFIEKWVQRPRKYGNPDQSLISQVAVLEAHVVPVANKCSKIPQTEWRICYTRGELLLLQSLNEVQIKLYILLKLMAKSVLKPLCSEMSSYIMKNIVLWMVEKHPQEKFLPSHLIERLTDALVFLKDCLCSNDFRSYMIEERNLFEGRVTADEKEKLVTVLDTLISENNYDMLQRCDKIRFALDKLRECPVMYTKEAERRNYIEKLILRTNIIFKESQSPFTEKENLETRLQKNDLYKKYKDELYRQVIPDKERLVELGQNCEEVYRKRLVEILS